MQNGKSLRVVVVGAGIVGASIAYHLAHRQVAVTVLELPELNVPLPVVVPPPAGEELVVIV